jgi:hypothetical protein
MITANPDDKTGTGKGGETRRRKLQSMEEAMESGIAEAEPKRKK